MPAYAHLVQSLVALGAGLSSGGAASARCSRAACRFFFFSAFLVARCSLVNLLRTLPELEEFALDALVALLADLERVRLFFGVVLRPLFCLRAFSSSRSSLTSLAEAAACCESEPLPDPLALRLRFHRLVPSTGQSAAASVWRSHTVPMYAAYSSAALRSSVMRFVFSSHDSLPLDLPLPLPPMHARANGAAASNQAMWSDW